MLVDGFRVLHPAAKSATCWAQKKAGAPEQREHWKRYDYALVSACMLDAAVPAEDGTPRLVEVRHRGDAFEGGRPDHVPVESVLEVAERCGV